MTAKRVHHRKKKKEEEQLGNKGPSIWDCNHSIAQLEALLKANLSWWDSREIILYTDSKSVIVIHIQCVTVWVCVSTVWLPMCSWDSTLLHDNNSNAAAINQCHRYLSKCDWRSLSSLLQTLPPLDVFCSVWLVTVTSFCYCSQSLLSINCCLISRTTIYWPDHHWIWRISPWVPVISHISADKNWTEWQKLGKY